MVVCHCRRVNDRTITELAARYAATMEGELLEQLVVGEENHLDWIETQKRVIADIGIELYLQAQLGD